MQIDHDPNERRITKGETIFVTVVTFVVLTGLGWFFVWVRGEYGTGFGLAVIAAFVIVAFAIAFWLEAKKKRSRG